MSVQSTFLEIHFTKLTKQAKLTNADLSVSLHIIHSDVLCKTYTRMDVVNKVQFKAPLQNTLEHTLLHKLHSGIQFVKYTLIYFHIKYTWINISLTSLVSEFPKTSTDAIDTAVTLSITCNLMFIFFSSDQVEEE